MKTIPEEIIMKKIREGMTQHKLDKLIVNPGTTLRVWSYCIENYDQLVRMINTLITIRSKSKAG